MSLGGLHTVSFYNPLDGTVVQLNSIQEKEGELIIGRPFDENKNTRGEAIYAGGDNMLELLVDGNSAMFTQILAWERAGTRVRAVGAGFQRNLQWYEDTLIQILPKNHLAPGNLNGRVIRLHRPGPDLQIFANRNLLAFLGWQDANANNAADNYNLIGAGAISFSAGIQTLSSAGNNPRFEAIVEFPLSGILVMGSCDVTTRFPSGANTINLRQHNFAASVLLDTSIGFSSNGVKSASAITLASIYSLRPYIIQGAGVTTGNQGAIRNPSLTTDGSLTPGTSFMDF